MTDNEYMDLAIEIARSNMDPVTNKGVGCIIVNSGLIVGTGCRHTFLNFLGLKHKAVHAEHHALLEAGKDAKGSTVYVTMSPCAKRWYNSISWHFQPCVDLLIKNNVFRVVIGDMDNSNLGRGAIEKLQKAGIAVKNLGLDLSFLTKNAIIDESVKHEYVHTNFIG